MTTLAINESIPAEDHVITGPELFEAPTVTVVDGMRIFPRRQSGHAPVGQATLFRLAGECFDAGVVLFGRSRASGSHPSA